MFSSLGFSEIENTDNSDNSDNSNNSNNSNNSRNQCGNRNKNKNKNKNKQNLADIKKAMHQAPIKETFEPMGNESDDDVDNYQNFNSNDLGSADFPPKPVSIGGERRKEKENKQSNRLNESDEEKDDYSKTNSKQITSSDNPVSKEGFREMSSDYAKQYYGQYIPFSNPSMTTQSTTHNGDFMKKLNYMIHLLEDQKDEKVNGITEELVLYLFLGIFIIFLVDSFVKVGKYIR